MQHAPCGRHHHRRGKLFSCGRGSGGRLGLGAACEDVAVPARVTGELLHEEIMQADTDGSGTIDFAEFKAAMVLTKK